MHTKEVTGPERQATGKQVCLVIVDEHTVVRDALVQRLSRCPTVQVLGAVADVTSALPLVASGRPDLVLYEPKSCTHPNTTDFASLVAAGKPIVVWTSSVFEDEVQRYRQAGAAAVLLKDPDIPHLVSTLASVTR